MQWFHQTAGRQRTIPFVFFSSPFGRLDGNLKAAAAHRFKCDDEGWPSKKKSRYLDKDSNIEIRFMNCDDSMLVLITIAIRRQGKYSISFLGCYQPRVAKHVKSRFYIRQTELRATDFTV